MELKTILSKFIYRIEPKPGAGFIATCKDSTAPAIEGATRQEVQRKIQESIAANLGTQFPALQSALAAHDVNQAGASSFITAIQIRLVPSMRPLKAQRASTWRI